MTDLILPFSLAQGASRMRGRLSSADSFDRANSPASEKVPKRLPFSLFIGTWPKLAPVW